MSFDDWSKLRVGVIDQAYSDERRANPPRLALLSSARELLLLLALGATLLAVADGRSLRIGALPEGASWRLFRFGLRGLSASRRLTDTIGGRLLDLTAIVADLDFACIVRCGVLETLLSPVGSEPLGLDLGGLGISARRTSTSRL